MKVLISLVVLAGVVVGVFALGLVGGRTVSAPTSATDRSTIESSNADSADTPQRWQGKDNLAKLSTLGTAVECTISYDSPEHIEPITGTYFVSNNRIRGDFEMHVPEMGGQMVSSMIMKNNKLYSWSDIDGETYGVILSIDGDSADTESATARPIPEDAPVSYNCTEWKEVDLSIFEPPSDVLFQDFDQIIQAGMEYGTIYTEE